MAEESELEITRKAFALMLLGYKPKEGQNLRDFVKDVEKSLEKSGEANLESI